MATKIKSVKLAVVSIKNDREEPIAHFVYIDGVLDPDIAENEAANLAETIPVSTLNEFYLSEMMPETVEEF